METKELENKLRKEVDTKKTPSIQYYFFDREGVLYHFSYGLSDVKKGIETTDETRYCAYSVTKTFTSLAVLQLMQNNQLNINEPIKKYIKDFPYDSAITIKQILNHISGIPNPIPLNWIHLPDDTAFERDKFFNSIIGKNKKLVCKPGTKYKYSNLGYYFLGKLIEVITHRKYEDYIRENVISKLGLSSEELGFEIMNGRLAVGYNKTLSSENALIGLFVNKQKFMYKSHKGWKPYKGFYVNGVSYGGLIGTPGAFVKFVQSLLKNEILLNKSSKEALFEEGTLLNGNKTGVGLAWFKGSLNGNIYFAHAGGGGGYYSEIRIYPYDGYGSVIMLNRTGMKDYRKLDDLDKFFFN